MLQNSKTLCGLFCVRAELMTIEGTIYRRPLNSTGSIFADGSSLTAARIIYFTVTSRLFPWVGGRDLSSCPLTPAHTGGE